MLFDKKLDELSQSGYPTPSLEIHQRIPGGFFLAPNLDSQNLLPLLGGVVDLVGDLRGVVVRYSFAELGRIKAEGTNIIFCGVNYRIVRFFGIWDNIRKCLLKSCQVNGPKFPDA